MKHYYSAVSHGFYSDLFHGPRELPEEQTEAEIKAGKRPRMVPNPDTRIPKDAVEITAERHAELMGAQSSGKVIVARGGKPVAMEPVLSAEDHDNARRAERDRRLKASDWTQLPDSPIAEPERTAWAQYRQQLRDLDMADDGWPVEPNRA